MTRSTESCWKGQVQEEGSGERAGVVRWVLTFICWQRVQLATNWWTKRTSLATNSREIKKNKCERSHHDLKPKKYEWKRPGHVVQRWVYRDGF